MGIERFSVKQFFSKLLENDDYLSNRDRRSYTNGYTQKKLLKMCQKQNLPSSTNKDSIIAFLELDDKVRCLQSSLPDLTQIIMKHELLEQKLKEDT